MRPLPVIPTADSTHAGGRRALQMAALGALLAMCGVAQADKITSRQITPIDKVKGTCSIETNAKDKSLTYECEFENTSDKDVRFVFCAMADLTDAKKEALFKDDREFKAVPGAKKYKLKQVGGATGKLVCDLVDPKGGALSPASVYFGCKEIAIKKGEKKKFPIGSVAGYKLVTTKQGTPDQEVPFDKLKAADFAVVYTDLVNLTSTPMKKFDPDGTCNGSKGQGNFIEYDRESIGEGVASQWAYENSSFVDPFVAYQAIVPPPSPLPCDANRDGVVDMDDVQAIFAARNALAAPGDPRDVDRDGRVTVNDARICTLRLTRQYVSYNDPPCVPTGFPARVPQLPPCAVRSNAPPASSVDLNLFSWYTEIQPQGERLPATLHVSSEGDLTGLRIETTPPAETPFDMLGGVDLYGKLRVCASASTTTCLAPHIAEGRRLAVTIDVESLDEDDPSFVESGQFIQDTVPPRVNFHSAQLDAGRHLVVTFVAEDATTSPIYAELWFSVNAGLTWDRLPLAASPDTLDELAVRSFAGATAPIPTGRAVSYFVVINDSVSNVVVFGVGTVGP